MRLMPRVVMAVCLALAMASPGLCAPVLIRVSPALMELDVERGETRSLDVALGNDGKDPATVQVFLGDLSLTPDGLPVIRPAGSQAQSCAAWLMFDKPTVRIEPGQVVKVQTMLRVPTDARGGAYGVICFRLPFELDANNTDHLAITVEGTTGTVLMLKVNGPSNVRGTVEGGSCKTRPEGEGLVIQADVRNTGDTHFRCSGEAVILDGERRVLTRLPLEAGTGTVLPGGLRTLQGLWAPRQVKPGAYSAQVRVIVDGGRALRYTIDFVVPE